MVSTLKSNSLKVLNLSSNDYANMAHENAKALRHIGVDCRDAKTQKHVFKYPGQSQIIDRRLIRQVVKSYDVVQVFHSDPWMFDECVAGKAKKIVVYHTGTRYREDFNKLNRKFEKADVIITDQCEFLKLHPMHYLAPHVDLKPTAKRSGERLIIGHYPSNAEVKGTSEIIKMLQPFKDRFEIRIDTTNVSHEENIKRIAECDIYIEMFKPQLNGKRYGCFGVTAFEAAALGCVVVTNCLDKSSYMDAYGDMPFLIANTKNELNVLLKMIDAITISEIREERIKRIQSNHNITATGKRILKLIS